MVLDEARIPISEEVKGACEILGLDPLYVANEGKLLAIVPADAADAVLAAMQAHPLGRDAAIIGEVTADHAGFVLMKTRIGGTPRRRHALRRATPAHLLTRRTRQQTAQRRRPPRAIRVAGMLKRANSRNPIVIPNCWACWTTMMLATLPITIRLPPKLLAKART